MESTRASILSRMQQYYDEKIQLHGSTPVGVGWNSIQSQQLRFAQLIKIVVGRARFSINDFGCGYGALADYLRSEQYSFMYCGFDVSPQMITKAKELHEGMESTSFVNAESDLSAADYTVASGVFNLKAETPDPEWEAYIFETLETLDALSTRGFAFNILTAYSDRELMRPDLYYANPGALFDHCKTKFSRSVALLHDYPLYEFTILVRKD
jgi:SAM-dependent methyltransferase